MLAAREQRVDRTVDAQPTRGEGSLGVRRARRELTSRREIGEEDDVGCFGAAGVDAGCALCEHDVMNVLRSVAEVDALLEHEGLASRALGEASRAARRVVERRDPVDRQELGHSSTVPAAIGLLDRQRGAPPRSNGAGGWLDGS